MNTDTRLKHFGSNQNRLKLNHLSLSFLVSTQLKMFCPLDWNLESMFARVALQTKDQLLGGLRLKINKIEFD
jgi:hypothetical protein